MVTSTARKNGATKQEAPHVPDLQEVGRARFREVEKLLDGYIDDINRGVDGVAEVIHIVIDESLWIFARDAEDKSFEDWKSCVKSMLGTRLQDWSEATRKSFIVMLVDLGYSKSEAAEITDDKPSVAKKAVDEANKEAEGESTEDESEVTEPTEPTAQEKADKIANQTVAQNKRCTDALYDMSIEKVQLLATDVKHLLAQVEERLKDLVAEEAGSTAA